ncbi:hypothetical protein [Crossiella equi]|uniref:hypothetical protein n=1 Tax=Crossiella equi TaxID=130796 RepID=UPI000A36BD6A|nr:hypothetical protein [Crossiella equi]
MLADGREVGATPVRRDWREATVLLGFPGRGSGITRTELDLVAYDAEPVPAPPTGTARLDRRLSRPGPPLADPSAELHDAAGRPVPAGEPMPRGRAVLEIRLTATTPEVAGLAGLEVRLDGERLAVLPTAADGPAVAGTWRIALNLADTTAGPHNIEVRAVGTSWDTAAAPVFVPIMVAQ